MHVHPDPDWIIELTPMWAGERFRSGRPKVATAVARPNPDRDH